MEAKLKLPGRMVIIDRQAKKKPGSKRYPVFMVLIDDFNQFDIEHQSLIRTNRRIAACTECHLRWNKDLPGRPGFHQGQYFLPAFQDCVDSEFFRRSAGE